MPRSLVDLLGKENIATAQDLVGPRSLSRSVIVESSDELAGRDERERRKRNALTKARKDED